MRNILFNTIPVNNGCSQYVQPIWVCFLVSLGVSLACSKDCWMMTKEVVFFPPFRTGRVLWQACFFVVLWDIWL